MLESLTQARLSDMFPEARIKRTTSMDHAGDFHLTFNNIQVLLECKNYSNAVPTAEVDKFIRDVRECGIPLGVMYSLGSGITGKKRVDVIRSEGSILAFVTFQSESELAGLGVIVRSLLAINELVRQSGNKE